MKDYLQCLINEWKKEIIYNLEIGNITIIGKRHKIFYRKIND